MKQFWQQNIVPIIIFIINILFFLGMYYGVLRTELDGKPNESRVREIIKEELVNKFSITDGRVLETQFKNLEEKVEELKTLMQDYINQQNRIARGR